MKKVSIILALAAVTLLVAGVGVALAAPLDYNVHGGYTSDTSSCGQCHATHAAAGQNLIQSLEAGTQNDVYRTCVYCHKSGGQSRYDVVNGAILAANGSTYAANGGGFAQVVSTEGATPAFASVDSKHDVDAAASTLVWAPGYDTAATMELTCSSCHDPHATGNNETNTTTGVSGRALRTTILSASLNPQETITAATLKADETVLYTSGWNNFCGACHKDFNQQGAGSGDANSGDYSSKKRHRVEMDPTGYAGVNTANLTSAALSQPSSMLPLQGTTKEVTCLTCHYAHGSSATNTVTFNRTNGSTSVSSTLLRLNNRGVCQACHNK